MDYEREQLINKQKEKINDVIMDLAYHNQGEYRELISDLERIIEDLEEFDGERA